MDSRRWVKEPKKLYQRSTVALLLYDTDDLACSSRFAGDDWLSFRNRRHPAAVRPIAQPWLSSFAIEKKAAAVLLLEVNNSALSKAIRRPLTDFRYRWVSASKILVLVAYVGLSECRTALLS